MTEIIPAILPKDFEEIEAKLEYVKGFARNVQIDICDGFFVPSKTWPFTEDSGDAFSSNKQTFQKLVNQETGMPFWEDFDFEYDLMVKKPYEKIPDFIALGASRIIVHLESAEDAELKKIAEDYGKKSEALGPFSVELGLGIRSTSDKRRITDLFGSFQFVQVMGIKNVGFQRQPLDEDSLDMIKNLRHEFSGAIISVDGGVNLDTAKLFIEAGADRLVVGSAIFDNEDPQKRLKQFQTL